MKTKLLLFASVLFLFVSCEESLTVDVNTNLTQDVDVDAVETTRKSSGINFDNEVDLNFEDNKELKENLDKLKEIDFQEASFTIADLPEDVVVDLTVSLPKYGISQTFTDVKNGSVVKLNADNAALLNSKADDIINDKKIKVKVNGTATVAGTFKIKINFAVKLKVGV